eukprot:TRINITY_DN5390_c3_g1_i14.p1 TRINITY_DN5390_c3_g1~~TRINITY_DN5390_c3_g1_i14.p1  ORF type:complete len:360 (+),score=72.58 TRINITY_DN5390_c3_g1_i14:55-1134(+)
MQNVDAPSGMAMHGEVWVAVDIGGTNARVAVMGKDGKGKVTVRKLNAMKSLMGFLKDVETVVLRNATVAGTAIAGPGPRNYDGSVLGPFSNYTPEERLLKKSALPTGLFPPSRTVLLNDLEAAAYGIAALSEDGRYPQYFTKMWGPHEEQRMNLENGPYFVLAVGTGCGTGLTYYKDGKVGVMPVEFGHTTIVPESEDRDWLFELGKKLYKKDKLAEYEDIVGGAGLVRCWEKVSEGKNLPVLTEPVQVAKRAQAGCATAVSALSIHYKYLFSLASDMSMGFVLGGVVIAGDNVLNNEFFIENPENQAVLKSHFLSHTMDRMGFQSRVNVVRQTKRFSLNIEGAFFKAKEAGATKSAKL